MRSSYADVWHLEPVAEQGGAVYCEAGRPSPILALHPRPKVDILGVTFTARS